jgi:hypothetical protein
MANYRQVHTKIWKDGWFLGLRPDEKLFFIYLFTNDSASIAGIYEIAKPVMIFETGLSGDEIDRMLDIFEEADKAYFRDGVVWVRNLRKYHETKSPKVQAKIAKDLDTVPEGEVKGIYLDLYGIDRVSGVENRVGIPPSTSTSISIRDLWREVTETEPGRLREPMIAERLGDKPNRKMLELAWRLWMGKGYSAFNIDGILDYYDHLLSDPKWRPGNRNFNGPAGDAALLWASVETEISRVGARGEPSLPDETMKTIKRMGGWSKVCYMKLRDSKPLFQRTMKEVAYG